MHQTLVDLQLTRKIKRKRESVHVLHPGFDQVQGKQYIFFVVLYNWTIYRHLNIICNRLCQMSVERVDLALPQSNIQLIIQPLVITKQCTVKYTI